MCFDLRLYQLLDERGIWLGCGYGYGQRLLALLEIMQLNAEIDPDVRWERSPRERPRAFFKS